VGAGDVEHPAPDPGKAFSAELTGLAPDTVVHVTAKLATPFGTISGAQQDFVTAGSGAPGALGLPPVPRAVRVKATRARGTRLHRVRIAFTLSRKWKVSIVVHKRTRRGPVVARFSGRFKKGANTTFVKFRSPSGRVVIVITPRAGKTITRTVTLR
jgi:hypothetical protein